MRSCTEGNQREGLKGRLSQVKHHSAMQTESNTMSCSTKDGGEDLC